MILLQVSSMTLESKIFSLGFFSTPLFFSLFFLSTQLISFTIKKRNLQAFSASDPQKQKVK